MMPLAELVLPWPSRDLHPNVRVHWSRRAKAAKFAREFACFAAMQAGWREVVLPDGRLHLWIDFYPPNKRKRDDDGLVSSFKPWRDGIADALKIDDHRFVTHPYLKDEVRHNGEVRVRITSGP